MEYKAFEEQLQTTLLGLKKREERLAEAELEVWDSSDTEWAGARGLDENMLL